MARARRSKGPAAQPFQRPEGPPRIALRSIAGPAQPAAGDDGHDLMATIESEIIPRLLLAHRPDPIAAGRCAAAREAPTRDEVAEFARIAACHDLPAALKMVEAVCREGLSLEVVLLDLVAAAARLLGEQWKEDLRSFTEVSAGLGTLQQLVHVLGPSFAPALPHRGLVVLVAAPGEQHTLGLFLVGEFLRRAGWGVEVAPTMAEADLLRLLSSQPVAMLGITVSNEVTLKPLARFMTAVRKATRKRDLPVLLGGALDLGDFAEKNGASLHASDAREAVRWLDQNSPGRDRAR